jgi:hypothetical protein
MRRTAAFALTAAFLVTACGGARAPVDSRPGVPSTSGFPPPIRSVPGVTDLTLDQALTRLKDAGLKGQVDGASGAGGSWIVIRQRPDAGSRMPDGSYVVLTVRSGTWPSG